MKDFLKKYEKIVKPSFGIKSFDAMLKFTKDCQKYISDVKVTVVDTIGEEEIADFIIIFAMMEVIAIIVGIIAFVVILIRKFKK